MTLSAICNVNNAPIPVAPNGVTGVNVLSGATVTITLANQTGVNSWSINCTETDGYNPGSTVQLIQSTKLQTGFSCTFTMPSMDGYLGAAAQFTSIVNNNPATTTTFGIFVLNNDGTRLFFPNENLESNSISGCAYDLNAMKATFLNQSGISVTNALNIVTVGPAGSGADYITTGTADDVVINAAITYAVSLGYGTIMFLPGHYYCTNAIIVQSNIHLTALERGTVKIYFATGFNDNSNSGLIVAAGYRTTGVPIVLSQNMADGYNYAGIVSSSESANLTADSWVYMASTTLWETTELSGRTIGEFMRINTVSTNWFSIWGWARSTYLTSATAECYRQTFVTNVVISNLDLSQQAALGSRTNPQPLVLTNQCLDAKLLNCILHDNDQAGHSDEFSIGTQQLGCYTYRLTDNTSLSQYGYGIQAHGVENPKYEGNTFDRVRHGLTTGGGSYGVSRGINFSGNTISHTTNSGIDTHNQSETTLIANNTVSNCPTFGIFDRGRSSVISNNAIEWCGSGIQVGLNPYQVSGGSGAGTSIIGNKIRNITIGTTPEVGGNITTTGTGIVLDLTDNVTVQGNILENCYGPGINLQYKVKNCVIRNNLVLNCNINNVANVSAIQLNGNFTTSAGSITAQSGSTSTFSYSGTNVQNFYPGQNCVITGAATSANNGTFPIVAMLTSGSFTYTNASGVAGDANNTKINVRVENVTDNIIENNTAINTAASEYDPNSTGGFAAYFCDDQGTNTAGANVRNTFRNNQAYGMVTGLYNIQNTLNTYSQLANNTYLISQNAAGTADIQLLGAFTNNAVVVGDGTNGVAVNLQSNTGNVNFLEAGSSYATIAGNPTGATSIATVAGVTSMTISQTASTSTSAGSGSNGANLNLKSQAGQPATGATHAGGAGGNINITPGAGGTSGSSTAGIGGKVELLGGLVLQTISINASTYTCDTNTTTADIIVLQSYSSTGTSSITLPTVLNGRRVTIKDISGLAGTNNITVGGATGNIDGSASAAISSNYGLLRLISNGTNWFTI